MKNPVERGHKWKARFLGIAIGASCAASSGGCTKDAAVGINTELREEHKMPERIENLRQKYAGKIIPGMSGTNFVTSVTNMQELLKEWDTRGASIEELKYVIGLPTKQTLDSIEYRFIGKEVATMWVFQIKDGRVMGFKIFPGA